MSLAVMSLWAQEEEAIITEWLAWSLAIMALDINNHIVAKLELSSYSLCECSTRRTLQGCT